VSHEAGNTAISVLAKTVHQATQVTSIALQKKTVSIYEMEIKRPYGRELQIGFY
jgi:hypothetical protein